MASYFNNYFNPIYIVCRIVLMWEISLDDSKRIFNNICTFWKICFLFIYTYSCYDFLKFPLYINKDIVSTVVKYSDFCATLLLITTFYLYIFINFAKRHNIKRILLNIGDIYLDSLHVKVTSKIILCKIMFYTGLTIFIYFIVGYTLIQYLGNQAITNFIIMATPFMLYKIENCVSYFIINYLKLFIEEIQSQLKDIYLTNEIVVELIFIYQKIIDILNDFAKSQSYYIIILTMNSFVYSTTILNFNIKTIIFILRGNDFPLQVSICNINALFGFLIEIFISVFIFCDVKNYVSIK